MPEISYTHIKFFTRKQDAERIKRWEGTAELHEVVLETLIQQMF